MYSLAASTFKWPIGVRKRVKFYLCRMIEQGVEMPTVLSLKRDYDEEERKLGER